MATHPDIPNKTHIWRMKVQPLRDTLENLGLDSTGDHTELKKGLLAAIFPDDSSQNQSNFTNVTGDSSQPDVTNVANNFVSSQTNVSNMRNHLEDIDSIIKISKGPVFKRIPKASRLQACIAFAKLLQCVIDKNDRQSWENLLNFARLAIGNSKRGVKKKKSQATGLNKRIEAFMAGSPHQAPISTMKR